MARGREKVVAGRCHVTALSLGRIVQPPLGRCSCTPGWACFWGLTCQRFLAFRTFYCSHLVPGQRSQTSRRREGASRGIRQPHEGPVSSPVTSPSAGHETLVRRRVREGRAGHHFPSVCLLNFASAVASGPREVAVITPRTSRFVAWIPTASRSRF